MHPHFAVAVLPCQDKQDEARRTSSIGWNPIVFLVKMARDILDLYLHRQRKQLPNPKKMAAGMMLPP